MTTAKKPDALPVVAYIVTNLPSGEPSLCFEDERGDYDDEDHTPVFEAVVLLSDAQASLLAKEAEIKALKFTIEMGNLPSMRRNADRYEWLRMNRLWLKANLPGIAAPLFDEAIDAARAAADQGGAS
jgi:hypothetical protein